MIAFRQLELRQGGHLRLRQDERLGAAMRQHEQALGPDDDAALVRKAGADGLADRVGRQLAAVVPPDVNRAAGGVLGARIGQLHARLGGPALLAGRRAVCGDRDGDVSFSARYGGL